MQWNDETERAVMQWRNTREFRRWKRRAAWHLVKHSVKTRVDWLIVGVWVSAPLLALLFWLAVLSALGLLRG